MELKEQFEKAVARSRAVTGTPGNDVLLQLYSLYKQSTLGDVTEEPPSNPFDFVNKAKYDAWKGQKGKTKEAAMQEYIALVDTLK